MCVNPMEDVVDRLPNYIFLTGVGILGLVGTFIILLFYTYFMYSVKQQLSTLLMSSLVLAPIFSGWITSYYYEKRYGEFVRLKSAFQSILPIYVAQVVFLTFLFYFNDIEGLNFEQSYIYAAFQIFIYISSIFLFGKQINKIMFKKK